MKKNNFYLLLMVLCLASCSKDSEPVIEETATNIWTEKTKFSGGHLASGVSFTIEDKLYVGTGIHGAFENTFFVYNTKDNSWKGIKSLPSDPRANAISFSIGKYGYVGLGYSCIGEGLCTTVEYNDLWRYNTENDSWAKMADFPVSSRAYGTSFVINDKAFVVGSTNTSGNDVWEYNSSTNTWTQKAAFPGNCQSKGISFSLNNKGYVGFGWWGYTCKDFWEYNPVTDTWKETAVFPGEARYGALAFSLKNKGYVAMGLNQGDNSKEYLTNFWTYDPVNNKWAQINTNYPGKGRIEMIGGVVENKIIMGLGANNILHGPFDRFDDIWEYTPDLK